MLEEPKMKKVDKRDKHLPQNFEQLIEMYDMEKIWPYILKTIQFINEEIPEGLKELIEGQGIQGEKGEPGITGYSTEEQVIGTWIDGKPLYRKTIQISSLPNNTATHYEHNIENVDRIWVDVSNTFAINNNETVPLINVWPFYGEQCGIYVDRTIYCINTNKDYSGRNAILTFKYTKTTD